MLLTFAKFGANWVDTLNVTRRRTRWSHFFSYLVSYILS